MSTQIREWGDAILVAVGQFFAAIPLIIAFLAIILVGWFIASLVAGWVGGLLRRARFNELSQRSGFSGFVASMGVETDASGFIAFVTKWFIRLIALVVAFDALNLPAVSQVLRDLLLWLPNLVVAIVVLVIGGLAANALAGVTRGIAAKAELGSPDLLASVSRVSVWVFAVIVAVNQLGIATTLINTLFIAIVGGTALALGLAFGLGGREAAAEIINEWRERSREASPRLRRAVEEVAYEEGPAVERVPGRRPH